MATTPELRRIFKSLVMNPVARHRVDVYDPGYLVVTGEQIQKLARDDPRAEFPSAEFTDLTGKLVVPGFVDSHVHLAQFGIMGIGHGELLDWLTEYTYPEEARFANPQYALKISEMFFDEMLANGTTTAAVYSSIHEEATDIAFSIAKKKGIRAFIGKVMMDRNSPKELQEQTDDSIGASLRLFEKWNGAENGRLRYIFTPRFAGSCSMELMKRAAQIARDRGALVQSHLSENAAEVEWVRELFPECDSYAGIYNAAGLLGESSIMAHCVHLSDVEVHYLSRSRTKVAFCPYSNRTLRSGTMPYKRLRDAGLHISLGTDIAGGPSLSMIQQMSEATMASPEITYFEALYLATLAGAEALGISDRVGNFAPGKDADFVVMNSDKQSITEVYVRGRPVYF